MVVLYNLTLQKATAITQAIYGNFSAAKAQEIVVSRGKILELLRPDEETGKVQSIVSTEVFGVIRALHTFRLVGGTKDYIVVGSDSGRINILEYSAEKNKFLKVHEETFGKSGCRRIVPGQYLAVDPKGRAVMIGAIEKGKLVYVLNRDGSARLTISSPLEAHKAHSIVYSMCGVDVGFENPIFATIEVDTEEKYETYDYKNPRPNKWLVFYELDLGLNHVTRKWTDRVDEGANLVLTVPGGSEGPGGVLVCAENYVIWKNQDAESVRTAMPRRFGIPDDKGVLIVAAATHTQKNLFFFLIQSEYGDIYKVTLKYEEDVVEDVIVKYFDTVPPCNSLCVLKTGFLFCASEFGNHYLFQFQGIGDDDDTAFTTSASADVVLFRPRAPTNLALIDELESLSPILDIKVADLANEHTPQIYTLCGRGPRSSLRILRHGLAVTEMAVSELPGTPNGVWAVRTTSSSPFHKYIVVSFVNATIVLAIGETVVEVTDSGILDNTDTLSVSLLGDNSLLQIYPTAVRHIRGDKRIHEWKAPGKKTIVQTAVNTRQVLIALSGGELVYFELDNSGNLVSVQRKEMRNDVACLALAPVPGGRQRALFAVVGSFDNTVRVLSLDPTQPMHQMTVQALPAQPQSLCLVSMATTNPNAAGGAGSGSSGSSSSGPSAAAVLAAAVAGKDLPPPVKEATPNLYLYVGLNNGVMIRSILDEGDGTLSDARKRFLGTRAVKLFPIEVMGMSAVLALSTRSWLSYTHQGRFHMTPLSYEMLEHASCFASEQCPEGVVAVAHNTLRIVTVEKLGEVFNQTVWPLRYTPRKMIVHPEHNTLVIIEAEHNSYSYAMKKKLQATMQEDEEKPDEGAGGSGSGSGSGEVRIKVEEEDEVEATGGSDVQQSKRVKKERNSEQGDDVTEVNDDDNGGGEGDDQKKTITPKVEKTEDEDGKNEKPDADEAAPSEGFIGAPQAGNGKWASCIRIIKPVEGETTCLLELEDNEACTSMCLARLRRVVAAPTAAGAAVAEEDTQLYLVVGTNKDLELCPAKVSMGYVHLYKFNHDGSSITLVNKTEVNGPVHSVAAYQHRLLLGTNNALRVYELGKRRLLLKSENRSFPTSVCRIEVMGDRIYVGDACESFFLCKYNSHEKKLYVFADTFSPRYLTSSVVVDYDTLASGDKFGNLSLSRLPEGIAEELSKDPTGGKNRLMSRYGTPLSGLDHKLTDIVQYHVGEMITSICKTSLVAGGAEVLLYGTIMGGLAIALPFTTKEDVEFFTHLELHLRGESPPLCGRDHLAFRSAYFPVKDSVDGDLCEMFATLDPEKQHQIAEELVCAASEVSKKLEEMRNRIL